jgi:hypothetical protein
MLLPTRQIYHVQRSLAFVAPQRGQLSPDGTPRLAVELENGRWVATISDADGKNAKKLTESASGQESNWPATQPPIVRMKRELFGFVEAGETGALVSRPIEGNLRQPWDARI